MEYEIKVILRASGLALKTPEVTTMAKHKHRSDFSYNLRSFSPRNIPHTG
jgi:hypothetical protein